MDYKKSFLTVSDQVTLLESRGLNVDDRESAMDFLKVVNYYRFSSYTLMFEKQCSTPIRSHEFRENVNFSDVIKIYEFDHTLRLHSLKAIEAIEVAFRTRLCYHMSEVHGSHWYENPAHFIDPSNHSHFLDQLDSEIKRSREVFIKHYRENYTQPRRPPAWMVIELLSLGAISKLFSNIKDRQVRKKVAEAFGLPEKVLRNWILSLVFLRNFCAHHARIWNRQFSPLSVPKFLKGQMVVDRRFKDYIWCIRYMLDSIHRDRMWVEDLKEILLNSEFVDKVAMGFSGDSWYDDKVWDV